MVAVVVVVVGGEEDKVFARLKWAFSAAIQTRTFLEGPLYLRE